jgi:hypothetical protein
VAAWLALGQENGTVPIFRGAIIRQIGPPMQCRCRWRAPRGSHGWSPVPLFHDVKEQEAPREPARIARTGPV